MAVQQSSYDVLKQQAVDHNFEPSATLFLVCGSAAGALAQTVSGCTQSPCSPGACSPGACSPGACSPGACSPGACSPGACSPGACSPGACSPGDVICFFMLVLAMQ